jgi:hypothetical protein
MRPEQIDRIGREPVVSAQTLGDQQGLAGEVDRLIEAPEHVADAPDPVLDVAQRVAIVQAFGQVRACSDSEIGFIMDAVLGDAGQLQAGFDLRA